MAQENEIVSKGIQFSIVTNRPFKADVKRKLADIAAGTCTDKNSSIPFQNILS